MLRKRQPKENPIQIIFFFLAQVHPILRCSIFFKKTIARLCITLISMLLYNTTHVHAVDLQLSMTFLGPWADSVRLTDSADTEDYIIHATCVCCQFANGRPVRLGSCCYCRHYVLGDKCLFAGGSNGPPFARCWLLPRQ